MRVKTSKQPPPAPTTSAVGPCPTVIQIAGRPGAGSLPSTIAPPPSGNNHCRSVTFPMRIEPRGHDKAGRNPGVKMSKQPPPVPTASAVRPCPTVIKLVGRPGPGSLSRTIAPPDHPQTRLIFFCLLWV